MPKTSNRKPATYLFARPTQRPHRPLTYKLAVALATAEKKNAASTGGAR